MAYRQFSSSFPGQYYDQETSLHYNWNRYYDPTTGRYVTPDPIGLEGGVNLFVYVQNNPTIYIDLFGLWCKQKTPWEEVTCIQKPKFLYSYSKSTWTKIAEWNALPLPSPRTGRVAKIACCCLWEFMGYRKANVYERIILLEATFECCDEATGRYYLDKKYHELSQIYEEIGKLDREIIFEQRRTITCGEYLGSSTCNCDEPKF